MSPKFTATVMVFGLKGQCKYRCPCGDSSNHRCWPWIGSVANGGRSFTFQQDFALSRNAFKTQGYVDGREFSSSSHTKLMATSSLLIRP
ncbi:hypothetical protein ACTXT7_009404 [Hymenolepis weldensis]